MKKLTIFHDHSFNIEDLPGNGHMIFFEGFEEKVDPYAIALSEAEYVALYNVMKTLKVL